MKLPIEFKQEIQYFAYFLYRGLNRTSFELPDGYLDKLIAEPELLYNCYVIFAYEMQTGEMNFESLPSIQPHSAGIACGNEKLVGQYILDIQSDAGEKVANEIVIRANEFNAAQSNLWTDFLTLAKWFCFNTFPRPVLFDYVPGLANCGTDALSGFAVWTNVLEIDENLKPLNSAAALKRANDRIKLWDEEKMPTDEFEEWELEQVIY